MYNFFVLFHLKKSCKTAILVEEEGGHRVDVGIRYPRQSLQCRELCVRGSIPTCAGGAGFEGKLSCQLIEMNIGGACLDSLSRSVWAGLFKFLCFSKGVF